MTLSEAAEKVSSVIFFAALLVTVCWIIFGVKKLEGMHVFEPFFCIGVRRMGESLELSELSLFWLFLSFYCPLEFVLIEV